jgi:3-dehydroquinate synthase
MKLTCATTRPKHSYDIEICRSLALNPTFLPFIKTFKRRVVIVTDTTVATLYGERLRQLLESSGLSEILLCSFPEGERFKTRATKENIEDTMLSCGYGRDSLLIAIGGGIVTDIGGYVAATYCRGIPYILIPTTLLAMVDASIGGKTGVNTSLGKNLVGCIYQPTGVYVDVSCLSTLPDKNIREGIVEMMKHGLIADVSYIEFLEKKAKAMQALDLPTLEDAIACSCRIKMEFVEQDEEERGKRSLLNFGHTIGHALETVTDYALSHGEAVALGILAEAKMAVDLQLLSPQSLDRIMSLFSLYAISTRLPQKISENTMWDAMTLDKKAVQKTPRFVLLNGIGNPLLPTQVEREYVKKALDWLQQ